jgi:hypothetical protein
MEMLSGTCRGDISSRDRWARVVAFPARCSLSLIYCPVRKCPCGYKVRSTWLALCFSTVQ